MKIGVLTMTGCLLLLACMIFASANLATADHWAKLWLPFVIAGVWLVLFGQIIAPHRRRRR
jgi:hypothetical protein